MFVTCVTVYVKEKHIKAFIAATIENHGGSKGEAGNMRFDVLQCTKDQTRFFLYEAYESEEAAQEDKKTEHYLRWKKNVEPWMAKPREGIPHRVICPIERSKW